MRNLKRTILAAALLISFSAAGAALGNDVSAASLQAAEPAGPVSNTGRDYRIALINAENTRGPVIHKPLKEEKGTPVSRSEKVRDSKEDSTYREDAPSLRHHDREESQRLEEHRQHRFDKDDNDRDHHFDEHRQRRFDKDDNDRDHRFDEHRQHRFDKDKDPGRGRPGGRYHDRGERKSAAMQPEDARF
ncbi:hypothetical protein [uncultured Dialister sp.]|uniref:hypothetical protein n=1 Tax=uncultured Dialister sp. TaxID=278064 RepID=UPI0025917151|nr:hypothetical protein [uncultured Dialister sp.]